MIIIVYTIKVSAYNDCTTFLSHCICSSKFEKHAVGVLSHCYSANIKRSSLLLVRELKNFGFTTVMAVAAEASVNFNFITHASVQALINNVWLDHISADTKLWRVSIVTLYHNYIITSQSQTSYCNML